MWEVFGILFYLFMPFVYLFVLTYGLLALYVISSFKFSFVPDKIDYPKQVSIVIPFRNEAKNLSACIQSIREQEGIEAEVILVDDHSVDASDSVAEVASHGLDAKIMLSRGHGKKTALLTGIKSASYNLIYTTDADSILSQGTIKSMLKHVHYKQLNMLCGLVQLESKGSIFEDFQQAESAALVGLSAIFLNQERPATCNGANLMFRRDVFYQIGGYGAQALTSSGDDDLLMQKFAQLDTTKVAFHALPGFKVHTGAEPGINSFIHQRARWASKHSKYLYPYNTVLLVMMVSRIPFYFFLAILTGLFWSAWFYLPLALLLCADLGMALYIRRWLNFKLYTVFLMPVYQLYIPVVWLKSKLGKTNWKDREISISKEKI